jgi:flagellar export protein FliJ
MPDHVPSLATAMTTFQFRLQPILEHKRRLEEVAQVEHSLRLEAQQREEAALARLNEAEARTLRDLERQRRTGRLPVELLQLSLSLQDALKVQRARQATAVSKAQAAAAATRDALIGRVQERSILERLRERRLEEFTLEQQRVEGQQNDELIAGRVARAIIAARRPEERPHGA